MGKRRRRPEPVFPYRHKLLKWWAQSFLLGVPNVVAGFRSPEGSVCSLKTFPTMQMFEHVRVRTTWTRQGPRSRVQACRVSLSHSCPHCLCLPLGHLQNDRDGWNPSVCMNFCAAFLSFAQNTVVQDDPR